jgi:signal peptidase I
VKKFWDAIKDYVFIVIAVLIIRTFIVTPAIVSGASMDDTLKDGQLVIVNKFIYRFSDIKRFDIVVLENDKTEDKIIKRVIGLPNETIEYRQNRLYVNDELIEVDFDYKETANFTYTTKDGEYFVLGDNRPVSKDSRSFGVFTSDDFVGRVKYRLYPFSKFGSIEKKKDFD